MVVNVLGVAALLWISVTGAIIAVVIVVVVTIDAIDGFRKAWRARIR